MKIKKLLFISLLLAAGIFLKADSAFAATKTWAGAGSDNNFSTSANWSPSGAPSNGDDLVFDTGTAVTRSSPTNDISGLTVNTITFTGTDLGGVTVVDASTALTVTESISDSETVTAVTSITGNIVLGGDVTVRGISFSDETGSILLNGNTLTVAPALSAEDFILTYDAPISGTGGLVFDASNTQIQMNTPHTYSGTTIYRGGSILALDLLPSQVFGTSAITIEPYASLNLRLPDAANNTTWENAITIAATDSSSWTGDFSSFFLRSASSNILNIAIPNITLLGDARMGGENVIVNLAGITSNGHCVDYLNWSDFAQEWTNGAQFTNGPAFCVLAATTAPKVPDTGFGLIRNNPALILGLSAVAAGAILVIARRLKPATRRVRS